MAIRLIHPSGREPARRWIGETLLSRLLDGFECVAGDGDDWLLEPMKPGVAGRIRIADAFLRSPTATWMSADSLPREPLRHLDPRAAGLDVPLVEPLLPVLFGAPTLELPASGDVRLGIDIFGSAFLMLSRYEEAARPQVDVHGRFPASASVAFRNGFLERPIVDEYVELLWACMHRTWPWLHRRRSEFRVLPSHDVDEPSRRAFRGLREVSRESVGDALKRGALRDAWQGPWHWACGQRQLHRNDPFNTFEWIMDESERSGLRSAFYFVAGPGDPAMDPRYRLEHPAIRRLIARIHGRGHEVGLHPGYRSYLDPACLQAEARRLRGTCARLGVAQPEWGARMHYLRWHAPETLRGLQAAGIDYDATLGFADRIGFRCGTSHEYRAFDVVAGVPLAIRIRPLVAMDVTVLNSAYMGLGTGDEAYRALDRIKRACRYSGGNFTLLWHNNELASGQARELYASLLRP